MRISTRIAVALICLTLAAGCASMAPAQFERSTPHFDPIAFFDGPVRSWGVMESRTGLPRSRFRTEVEGRRDGDAIAIAQHFIYEDGHTSERSWKVWRKDAHHLEATASDVAGVAKGEAWGNAFYWEYTLEVRPGNPLFNVRMHQWMYLQADGTMMNRVRVTKLGFTVAQISEHFHRGAEPGASERAVQ